MNLEDIMLGEISQSQILHVSISMSYLNSQIHGIKGWDGGYQGIERGKFIIVNKPNIMNMDKNNKIKIPTVAVILQYINV